MPGPPADVVRALGGDPASLAPLPGGSGHSWRAGPVVLKPADETLVRWAAGFVPAVSAAADGAFRLAAPVAAGDGRWTVDGWCAFGWLDGDHQPGAWDRVLDVSRAFHDCAAAATGPEHWPAAMAARRDPWSIADRVAWGDEPADGAWPAAVRDLLARLAPHLAGARSRPGQIVHVDIGGNVLFADDAGLPPAVIDLSPQFRPAAYADAVTVADAVAWSGAPLTLALRYVASVDGGDEVLARAIAFRAAAAAGVHGARPDRVAAEAAAYARLLPILRP